MPFYSKFPPPFWIFTVRPWIFVAVGEKRTVAHSPEYIHRKSTTISISLKHIQSKNNSHTKAFHKSSKMLTIWATGLSRLNIYKIPKEIAIRSFWTQPVPDSFNLYFILFYIVNFLFLPLWTYTNRVCNNIVIKNRIIA